MVLDFMQGVSNMTKYKFEKQKKTLDKAEFAEIIEKGAFKSRYIPIDVQRAFLVLLYYLGLRVSELLPLTINAFEWTEDYVFIDAPPIKMGVERPRFKLSLQLPFMKYVSLAWYIARRRKSKVFPFTRGTAWNIVKRVMPEHYPHFFRLNRATSFLNKGWPPNKIRRWFGWKTFKTVESYLGYAEKDMKDLSEGLE